MFHFTDGLILPLTKIRVENILETIEEKTPALYEELVYLREKEVKGVISGGYALYYLGYTNSYGDIDIYVNITPSIANSLLDRYELRNLVDPTSIYKNSFAVLQHSSKNIQLICLYPWVYDDYSFIQSFDFSFCKNVIDYEENIIVNGMDETKKILNALKSDDFMSGMEQKIRKLAQRFEKYKCRFLDCEIVTRLNEI